MTLPIKRFTNFVETTNVGSIDFNNLKDNAILNSPINEQTESPQSLNDLNNTTSYQEQTNADLIKELNDNSINETETDDLDLENDTIDKADLLAKLDKIPTIKLDAIFGKMFPNNLNLLSLFRSLPDKCKKDTIAKGSMGRNRGNNGPCGNMPNGNSNCDAQQMANVLKGMNGNYNGNINNPNNQEFGATALGSAAYDNGFCNIFTSVTAGIEDPTVINRVATTLMNYNAKKGNFNGLSDIAKNTSGINFKAFNPNIIKDIAGNFKWSKNTTSASVVNESKAVEDLVYTVDPEWTQSEDDDYQIELPNRTDDFDEVMKNNACNKPPECNATTEIVEEPASSNIYAASRFSYSSPVTEIKNEFPYMSL